MTHLIYVFVNNGFLVGYFLLKTFNTYFITYYIKKEISFLTTVIRFC